MTSQEFRDRLANRTRLAGVALDVEIVERLEAYFRLLAHWNAKINLTALPLDSPTDETYDRLLVEPLTAGRFVPDSPLTWFDLGSGGGSPAIPLKILRTRLKLTMVEAKARKSAFLREASRVLGLVDTDVEQARFENLSPRSAGTADLVTVRAVRADEHLFAAAAQLLVNGGRVLWFGAKSQAVLAAPDFRLVEVPALEQPSSSIAVLERVSRQESG